MDRPGEKLRRVRERLKLTYRDVVEASRQLATRLGNPEFTIALSRLAGIENRDAVPSIYRLYSLCAVYRLDIADVLGWYGAPADRLPVEALGLGLDHTHALQFRPSGAAPAPLLGNGEFDSNTTTFLSRAIAGWGRLPLQLLQGLDLARYRYGLIGLEDWSMYPVLHPGSLVVIDDRARIGTGGWSDEWDRPIYFFELRDGYICGWCDLTGDRLVMQPHPASHVKPSVFRYPGEIDLVGRVTGVAMLLAREHARRPRASAARAGSPHR